MIFSYRTTLVDAANMRAKNVNYNIDTDQWLDVMRVNERGLYGNSAELVEREVLPLLEAGKLPELAGLLLHLDDQWRKHNSVIIFQLCMFVWAGFKQGKFSADVWAVTFGTAWQSGSRGMMAAVKLPQALVIEMFEAAPRATLAWAVEHKDENLTELYASLPDSIELYRGVSTGIDHFEEGFSWTRDLRQAWVFARLNCQTKKEIPGIITAVVPKAAILGLFSFEQEVVVNPQVRKLKVQKEFLRGTELRAFHKSFDVEENTRDVVFKNAMAGKTLAPGGLLQ